jgi:hypothetical protein
MPNYDSTARVPFKHGGSVKKPEVKRIILWKGKAKDWPGAKKAAEQLRNKKAEGGKLEAYKKEQERKGILKKEKKWIASPGKRRKTGKRQGTIGKDRKINPQWLEEKYNVELKADGGRIEYADGTDFKKWLQGKQKFEKKQTREQLHREYLEDKRRQKVAEQKQNVADGGRIGLKAGTKPKKSKSKALEIRINPKIIAEWEADGGAGGSYKTPQEYYEAYYGSADEYKATGGIAGLKKGGKADKKWIQKATKGMRKDKPCTGKKFGSATCPPGSKRYNLAKTFKKMARSKHASGDMVRYI